MVPRRVNIVDFMNEVYRSEKYRNIKRIERLSFHFWIFDRNYSQFRKTLDTVIGDKDSFRLWSHAGRHDRLVAGQEITRLLHNYVASGKALVEHTRVVIRLDYKGTDFLTEYNGEVKAGFVDNDLAGLIEELRNYSLHYEPLFMVELSHTSPAEVSGFVTIEHSFCLNRRALLRWDGWSKGKGLLASDRFSPPNQPDLLEVGAVAAEYYQQVKDFHGWLRGRLEEIHKADIVWAKNIDRQLAQQGLI